MTATAQPTLWDQPATRYRTAKPKKNEAREEFRQAAEETIRRLAQDVGADGFISESIRIRLENRGIEPPGTDPQRRWSCMAGILNAMVRRGEIVKTRKTRKAKRDEAHSNPSAVYVGRWWSEEPK